MAERKKRPERNYLQDLLKGREVDVSGIELPPETREKLQQTNEELRESLKRLLAASAAKRRQEQEEEDALLDAAIAFLEEKWGAHRECPYCHTADWRVSSPVQFVVDESEVTVPFFPITCRNCANTVFIDGREAGFFPGEDEAEEE